MPYRFYTSVIISLMLTAFWASVAFTLTPTEVLKLKEAGLSEETIQMMLQNEAESRISSDQVEQGYATDHMGSWQLRDGRMIHSTGKRRLPLDYPTEYPTPPPYAPYADPHIILSPGAGGHGHHSR